MEALFGKAREAEQALIGAVLLDPSLVWRTLERVEAEDFTSQSLASVYQAIRSLAVSGQAIDAVTVFAQLGGESEHLKEIIQGAIETCPNPYHIESYVFVVSQAARLRRLMAAASQISDIVAQASISPEVEEDIEAMVSLVFRAASKRARSNVAKVSDVAEEIGADIERLVSGPEEIQGISWGMPSLDKILGPLSGGLLVIVAARPSLGKSAFVTQLALRAATEETGRVIIFSLEMSKKELVYRLLALQGRVTLTALRRGEVSDKDLDRSKRTLKELSNLDLVIDDDPYLDISSLRTRLMREKLTGDLSLVVIDYLQLMAAPGGRRSRYEEISDISRGLKLLSSELEIPFVVVSQLSRAPELRADRMPQLSDLRESGAIEQDADQVLFLWREPDAEEDIRQLIVAKNRNGPIGQVQSRFWRSYLRFEEVRE